MVLETEMLLARYQALQSEKRNKQGLWDWTSFFVFTHFIALKQQLTLITDE